MNFTPRCLGTPLFPLSLALFLVAPACTDEAIPPEVEEEVAVGVKGPDGKYDASVQAVFVDFEFSGSFYSSSCFSRDRDLESQMLYTVGQLNGDNSVGRLDQVDVIDMQTEQVDGGCQVTYTVRMPVAWGNTRNVPDEYVFQLPRDMTYTGIETFFETYGDDCVDWGAHDVDTGSFWYYYRPARCAIAEENVVHAEATVSLSPINTTGKYPEYHRVWEDGTLRVVAVFGKYKDGSTSGDSGINAYNRFVREVDRRLSPHDLTTVPEEVPNSPGVGVPTVSFDAVIDDQHRVHVDAILVDNVRTAGAEFDALYGELSAQADLIVYNGHAGLGANIRALARKGSWVQDQYVIVFMNGCDTYAYLDSALFDAHAEVNPDDPTGTKHLDLVSNAMPSFFRSMAPATLALFDGLLSYESPLTYEQIFRRIDASEVVLVSGEQDNDYFPGWPGDNTDPPSGEWAGLNESGSLARNAITHFETPVLPAGRYSFVMSGEGDADLYVRVGEAPDMDVYDCRPYSNASDETCEVELNGSATIHLMVHGFSPSNFELTGSVVN